MIKVVRGNPTPEELAAALAVVRAARATADAPDGPPEPAARWSAPARIALRRLPPPGPRAWARTYWPG
ncbi:acyl-CoA carboxylase subunit epsilon [Streptomyces corynorhini]|uniref:Acyl-CoA carboxylase subunit epsilon n=1 Tax=Streptomyces corynorhini TaxID=2282652 RepID=A0A370BJQ1_9ACTN|nr:acyl-CoA carboxylase subunit epsilon [Streptomyces corynorhini]RDG39983.1 acyl-CoA carboxylase subunit epsilon [Streptomyces corynorhini]